MRAEEESLNFRRRRLRVNSGKFGEVLLAPESVSATEMMVGGSWA